MEHVFFIMLLKHNGGTQSKSVTRASTTGGNMVTIDTVLFGVGIELFDDDVDILGLSWRLGVWSISIVNEEHRAVCAEGHITEGFSINDGAQSNIGTSMHGDVSFVVGIVNSVKALNLDDSDFALTVESFQSEFRHTLIESNCLVLVRGLIQCYQMSSLIVLSFYHMGCFSTLKISSESVVKLVVISDPTLLAPTLWRHCSEYRVLWSES